MPIAVSIVDTVNWRPVLINTERTRREAALFARIGAIPIAHEVFHCMWRVFQRVICRVTLASFDGFDFIANRQHGIAEPV